MIKLFKNKLFILVFCFLLFTLLSFNKSQAHIEKYDFINETHGGSAWILYESEDSNIYLAVGNYNSDSVYANYNNAHIFLINNFLYFSSTSTGNQHFFGATVYRVDENYNLTQVCKYVWQQADYTPITKVAKIIDIHTTKEITNGNGNSVGYSLADFEKEIADPFLIPPQEITEILVEETEKAQIMEQMKKMIVGFLKYLAVLVISLLAFWKGWQFLSTQLRKA